MTAGVTAHVQDVVVVGAGLAGLSAAVHLAAAGRDVTVVEQGSAPGGKAGLVERDGYRFDTGPTVLTMPELIEQTFRAVDEEMDDHLTLHRLSPAYRAHYPDGSTLRAYADRDAMADEIGRVCGAGEADGYRRLAAYLQRLYRAEYAHFIDRNVDGPLDLNVAALARLAALGAFGGLEARIRRYLHDPRTIRLFSFQALYAGVAPHRARALYAVISYMDTVAGVFFPHGGMHRLPQALADLAERHGVTFRYGQRVERVETTFGGRARAVVTQDGDRLPADAVVITADPFLAFPQLLNRSPRRLRSLRFSPSCFLLLAGAPRGAADRDHHAIHFGRSWRGGFEEITRQGRLMSDPSFLVSTPTVTDPGLAPPGHHSHYVLFPTPNLADGHVDWDIHRGPYLDLVRRTLTGHGYPELAEDPQAATVTTPVDWQRRDCPAGTPFSAAHTLGQTGPFRTPNLAGENIVLAGAGTHPGVGIPMALISGRLAAERITGPARRGAPPGRPGPVRLQASGGGR
ncbi:phytoene desaturase family protein [Kitasatospora sp. NPDC048540]|uniref:phytoene desaturase family protein n=1 Tax=unclassified Kitasatospora TaxID=2633591 RepID=UPI00053BBADD|nr:phytoene desaturase family protein [Kitasatospora sp. MBT63]